MSGLALIGHLGFHALEYLLKEYAKERLKNEDAAKSNMKEHLQKYEWIWLSQEKREIASKVVDAIINKKAIPNEVYLKNPNYVTELLKEFKNRKHTSKRLDV